MFVKISKSLICIFSGFFFVVAFAENTLSQEVSVEFPEELLMVEFDKYILPRFKFKTQISLLANMENGGFDAKLGILSSGKAVFSDLNGFVYRLETKTSDAGKMSKLEKFISWFNSPSGVMTIEDFSIQGVQAFKAVEYVEEKEEVEIFDGDIASGLSLSQDHCKRCHVVDENSFAGIDSSPSFHAMRSFDNWHERFTAFWTVSPHLNVISITEVYEAGSNSVPTTIAPIELSLDQIDDILAYVASIKPKDLGKPINSW
tara:strand:+ start:397 stop:1173 length:777 start_codon:yes stop_codon:yes gene_type:complete